MPRVDDLSPDQRAVLQLLLQQRKSYAELATLLRIEPSSVRQRAATALGALGPPIDDADGADLSDWLLGQQDDQARASTLDLLTESPAALQWAEEVGEALRAGGLEPRGELPSSAAAETVPAPEPAGEPPTPAVEPQVAEPGPADGDPAAPPGFGPPSGDQPRPSKLGGILLLGGLAIVAVIVAIVALGGGDGDDTTTSAQTQTAQTESTATMSTSSTLPRIDAQVNLRPPPGGPEALGIAYFVTTEDGPLITIQTEKLEPNADDERYGLWLTDGPDGAVKLLGYSGTAVGEDGRFTGEVEVPDDIADYARIELSNDRIADGKGPRRPDDVVLRGSLR